MERLIDIYPTAQAVFDRVWDWFVVQRQPASLDENGECRYRGQNGGKCAVGCLIPDDSYDPYWELRNVVSLALSKHEAVPFFQGISNEYLEFLLSMQRIHDINSRMGEAVFPIAVERDLRRVANEYELTIPEGEPNGKPALH